MTLEQMEQMFTDLWEADNTMPLLEAIPEERRLWSRPDLNGLILYASLLGDDKKSFGVMEGFDRGGILLTMPRFLEKFSMNLSKENVHDLFYSGIVYFPETEVFILYME